MFFNVKLFIATFAVHAVGSVVADSIYGIATDTDAADFSTLVAAVDAADLTDTLSGDGTFTVFAPPNSAFEKLPEELLTKLLDPTWKPQLQDLLLYHTLDLVVRSTDLTDGSTTVTLNGEDITINLDPPRINENSNILIDDGLVDIEADNGVIHGIDTVMTPTSITSNIVDIAGGNDQFSTLVAAVTAAGLADALSGEGPLTVFAPTNEAFEKLEEGTVESLLLPENIDKLTDILKYHVVAANVPSSSLSNGAVDTLYGDSVEVTISDEGVYVNDAKVVIPDIIASNGIIHVIDTVLLPEEEKDDDEEEPPYEEEPKSIYDIAGDTADFSTLVAAVDAAGLIKTLSDDGSFTVFAPPNSAFEKLPAELVTKLLDPTWQPQLQDLLLYHTLGSVVRSTDLTDASTAATLNGEDITINLNPARINEDSLILVDAGLVDIEADNGVVHGIDTVLTPTSITSNIVDIAGGDDQFSTLVAAVTAAGLVDALSGEGPLTVFAPTNDAFDKLPEGTVDTLLLPENIGQLTDILKYHVFAANALSTSLSNGLVKTLNGDSVKVTISGSDISVNDANVIEIDVLASNGIVHVIDTVLLPPAAADAKPAVTPTPSKKPTNKPTPRSAKAFKSKSAKSSKSAKTAKTAKTAKGLRGPFH